MDSGTRCWLTAGAPLNGASFDAPEDAAAASATKSGSDRHFRHLPYQATVQRGAGAVERPYHHRPRLLLPAIDNPHGGAGRKCRRHHQLIALRRTGSQPCAQQQQREHFAHYPDPTKKYVCDPVHKY